LPVQSGNEAPQAAEELRGALDLVKDDALLRVLREVQRGRRKLGLVGFGRKVKSVGRLRRGGFERERGLAGLARPRRRHGRQFCLGHEACGAQSASNDVRHVGISLHECKLISRALRGVAYAC
jgi:hypothetical protein